MIARLWHGMTLTTAADAYLAFLQARAIPDYRGTPGNRSVSILRRQTGAISHFLIVTHWESLQSIKAFAGADIARPKYYPEDEGFLLEFEDKVEHYEIAAAA